MNGSMGCKPFKGYFKDWEIRTTSTGNKYVVGQFDGHPEFDGKHGHSSIIVNKTEGDRYWEVETMNSIYHLQYDEEKPDREFWDMG